MHATMTNQIMFCCLIFWCLSGDATEAPPSDQPAEGEAMEVMPSGQIPQQDPEDQEKPQVCQAGMNYYLFKFLGEINVHEWYFIQESCAAEGDGGVATAAAGDRVQEEQWSNTHPINYY